MPASPHAFKRRPRRWRTPDVRLSRLDLRLRWYGRKSGYAQDARLRFELGRTRGARLYLGQIEIVEPDVSEVRYRGLVPYRRPGTYRQSSARTRARQLLRD